ncbi:MAG: FkbM family methyltransferase [Methanosarcinales archaeon]
MPSQYNEDAIVSEYFGNRCERFLDIGAYNGVTFSNTHALISKGWTGVMVEASPKCFVQLQDNLGPVSGDVKFVCCAMGTHIGLTLFYDSAGAVASLHKEHMERWKKDQKDFMEIYVPIIRPVDLLKILPGPYQFISLDIEGASIDVLALFPDFKTLGTELICVEAMGAEVDKAHHIMGNWGYAPWKSTKENWFYRRK